MPLINGRRIAQVGGNYQYVFDAENILNLPGDAPGDLYVPGYAPQEVSVNAVNGMTITLSVPSDLGSTVPNARLQSNLTLLMRKLIEHIEGMANKENVVGQRILGQSERGGMPSPDAEVRVVNDGKASKDCLNDQQLAALASSLGRDTTFIWGPPGTGKTQTIGTIGVELFKRGRSVLVVSHTNTAVDQAIMRIADAIDPNDLISGRVIRVREPRGNNPLANDKYKEILLKTHTDRRSAELIQRREECNQERSVAIGESIRLSRLIDIYEWSVEAQHDIAEMTAELDVIQGMETKLEQAREELALLRSQSAKWETLKRKCRTANKHIEEVAYLDERLGVISRYADSEQAKLSVADTQLGQAEDVLAQTTGEIVWFGYGEDCRRQRNSMR